MIVKPRDKIIFVKDYLYCKKKEFIDDCSVDIQIDSIWVDHVEEEKLEEMWNILKELGLIKELKNVEYFYIPADTSFEIDDVCSSYKFVTLKINERVRIEIYSDFLVTEEANEDKNEIQISILKEDFKKKGEKDEKFN